MQRATGHPGSLVQAASPRRIPRARRLTAWCTAALAASSGAFAAEGPHGMAPLRDDELAAVRGADGIAFNLANFSLTSSVDNPLTLTYLSPNGSALTLSRLDLKRTDGPDPFADPYQLDIVARPGLADAIALTFPQNTAGAQLWTLTTDFSHCGAVSLADNACVGTTFDGGTLQVAGLALKGGGLFLAPSAVPGTQGIAFGLGTRLDIGSIGIWSHGRDAAGNLDPGDSLVLSDIHLADAATGGAWMVADLDRQPGLFNAITVPDPADSTRTVSYLHLQIGWPTSPATPVPAASLSIGDISFTTALPGGGAPVVTSLGSSSIASMQINYLDVRLKGGK